MRQSQIHRSTWQSALALIAPALLASLLVGGHLKLAYAIRDNETSNAYSTPPDASSNGYGFDIKPCLASGCTESMLRNDVCDQTCNHRLCEHDMGKCYKFYDYHGYGWDFEGCYATGCTKAMLFDKKCDPVCDSDVCHSDNWRCFTADEFQLYDMMGYTWDDDLPACYKSGCSESMLFNDKCDSACDTAVCHYDNWICEEQPAAAIPVGQITAQTPKTRADTSGKKGGGGGGGGGGKTRRRTARNEL